MASATTMGSDAERTHLEGRDREGVNIGLFHGDAVFHLFQRHVTGTTLVTGGGAALRRNEGIVDNLRDLEVSDACRAPPCDQNVSLGMENHR